MPSSPQYATGADIERQAEQWMNDPYSYFQCSTTLIHSTPREEFEAVQLAAINLRLAQRREQIPVLDKLATAQGINRVDSLDAAAALLFEHNVYKSYPVTLLARQRFDQLTRWLDRLTPYDLSAIDVSDCNSIDGWLTRLRDETPLDAATSSGTSGTLSVFPKSKRDYGFSARALRVQLVQNFGSAPGEDNLQEKLHVMTPMYRDGHSSAGGFAKYLGVEFCQGDESYLHTAFSHKISSDLMWLAGRLRQAQARGDMSRLDVPENLLARRDELEAMQREAPARQAAFIQEMVEQLKGQKVFAMGTTPMFYQIAQAGLDAGVSYVFSPDSMVMGGGGAKGMVLPDNVNEVILEFFGASKMCASYGMTELNTFFVSCEQGHYHFTPWVTPFVLDRDSGQPLPRKGVQTGRAAFFDMTHDGTWGGIVTGDKITMDWDTPCPCGRSTHYIKGAVSRFSDEGGDDKITCASTPDAQAEALDFLVSLDI